MRRGQEQREVWGSTGGDRGPAPLVLGGLALAIVAGCAALGFGMAALLRTGIVGTAPLRTALCLGGLMLTFLSGAVVLVRAVARRFVEGSAARRSVFVAGLAVTMGCAPALMILVVYLLSRGA